MRVKALAAKAKDLCLVPGSHIMEGASQLLQVVVCPPHMHSGHTPIPIHTNECKTNALNRNKIGKIKYKRIIYQEQ